MKQDKDAVPDQKMPGKGELIRDAVVFQFKLLVDGVRDFVLIPVSFAAAILSFLKPGSAAGREFYDVVAFGKTTEKKINLFAAADKVEANARADDLPDLDSLISDVEAFARREYAGERFAPARQRLDELRAKLQGMDDRTGQADANGDEPRAG